MHSRPHHHGVMVALWAGGPALLLFIVWRLLAPGLIEASVAAHVESVQPLLSEHELRVAMRRIESLASGRGFVTNTEDWEIAAAETLVRIRETAAWLLSGLMATLAAAGGFVGYRRINPMLRARNQVERVVYLALMVSSGVAVLTTLGIVLSMVGETLHCFDKLPFRQT